MRVTMKIELEVELAPDKIRVNCVAPVMGERVDVVLTRREAHGLTVA